VGGLRELALPQGLEPLAKSERLHHAVSRVIGDHDPARRLDLLTALASSIYHVDAEREGRLVEEALQLSSALADAAPYGNLSVYRQPPLADQLLVLDWGHPPRVPRRGAPEQVSMRK